jgi:hypothetical protein
MATIFSVVGSHHDDPDRLIMIGDDGQHYQLELPVGIPIPVEPSEEEWAFDPILPDLEELTA